MGWRGAAWVIKAASFAKHRMGAAGLGFAAVRGVRGVDEREEKTVVGTIEREEKSVLWLAPDGTNARARVLPLPQ